MDHKVEIVCRRKWVIFDKHEDVRFMLYDKGQATKLLVRLNRIKHTGFPFRAAFCEIKELTDGI